MTQADDRGIIVTCPSCQQRNRVPYGHEGAEAAKCKKCGTLLPAASEPIEVPSAVVFDALVASSKLPVVVDFWAPWCGPCRMVAPELQRVAANNAGRYLVVKVNTDAVTEVAARFNIRSIPTLTIVSGGRELGRVAGVRPASEIEAFAARTLAAATPRAS